MTTGSRHTWLIPDFGGKHHSFTIKYNDTWGRYTKFTYLTAKSIPFWLCLRKKRAAPDTGKLARHLTLGHTVLLLDINYLTEYQLRQGHSVPMIKWDKANPHHNFVQIQTKIKSLCHPQNIKVCLFSQSSLPSLYIKFIEILNHRITHTHTLSDGIQSRGNPSVDTPQITQSPDSVIGFLKPPCWRFPMVCVLHYCSK